MNDSTHTRTEIVSQVNALMQKGFEIDSSKLVPTASLFVDLGLDSLDAVDMLVHLEERFKVKINGEELMQIKTLGDVYGLVESVMARAPHQS